MKQLLFLYNHHSGRGRIAQRKEQILSLFEAEGYAVTAEPIDFARNPFDAHPEVDLAVVAGGDGTLNYLVNCMMQRGKNLPLGVIPAGTANDFARAIGMAKDPVEAARQIATGMVERIDCGRVNDLYFVNVFSFGLFTTTSQRTPDEQKHRLGKLAYIIEGIKELRRMHKIPLQIKTAQGSFAFDALIALIFNGKTAGGFRLARRASLTDGKLNCLLLEKRSFLHACWTMLRYLAGGSPRAVHALDVEQIELRSPLQELTDVDGQRGAAFPLTIHCLKGALQIQCAAEHPHEETMNH